MRNRAAFGTVDDRHCHVPGVGYCGCLRGQSSVRRLAVRGLASFVSGLVFALGLGISGMTRPVKVIGFLDFTGNWDPSLAFVMIGAIAVYFVAYRWSRRMPSPLLAANFSLPKRSDLDAKLILGAALFGAGCGLGGFC